MGGCKHQLGYHSEASWVSRDDKANSIKTVKQTWYYMILNGHSNRHLPFLVDTRNESYNFSWAKNDLGKLQAVCRVHDHLS